MSDDTTTGAPTGTDGSNGTTTAPAAGGGSTPQNGGRGQGIDGFPPDAQDYIRRLRQENAAHRNEVKEERSKRESLETDGAKALTDAEARANDLEGKLLRFEVAAEKGLPMNLAARLQGSTKEELEKDADALKGDFGITENGQAPSGNGGGFDGGVRRGSKPPPEATTLGDVLRGVAAAGR